MPLKVFSGTLGVFCFIKNLFIMIYKFKDDEQGTILELELFNEDNQSIDLNNTVNFMISLDDDSSYLSVNLTKKEVYHLIGALHLLHKEMI